MDASQIQTQIKEYITREFLQGDPRQLEPDSPLLDWGVLESLQLITVVGFIEDHFAVRIPDRELLPENFATLAAISSLVQRLVPAAS